MQATFNQVKRWRGIIVLTLCLIFSLSACVATRRFIQKTAPQSPREVLPVDGQDSSKSRLPSADSLRFDSLVAKGLGLDSLADSVALRARYLGLRGDSLQRDSLHAGLDSLLRDTLDSARRDSLAGRDSVPVAPSLGLDDIVEYKAKDSVVMLGRNMLYMFGASTVDYKDKGLEAEYMRMNLDSNLVYAHYSLDSLGKPRAHPKFKDGDQSYEAKSMNYNFKTNKGFITGVVTQQGEGYITAERTKKVDEHCMYMSGGRYSTCTNHEHPHFYLQLTQAKVRTGKNVVAGPSYLVIAGVPLPIGLPFGFFPFSSKYSSGVLPPSYGEETSRGIYLREGGYYWAINDYIDLAVTGDWYSRGSWGVNARSNYRKRYRYNGAFSASYLVSKTGDKDVLGTYSETTDFRLSWTHRQDSKANPNQSFSASVNFSTSKYNHNSLNTLYNPGVASQNTKSSSINYNRTFVGTPWTLSASIDATQTSRDAMVSLNSPNLSVSMRRVYPFKRKNAIGRPRWYEKISMSYSGQLRNSISTKESELLKKNIIKDWRNGINHSIPISASYKLLDHIDLTLSASYTERWYSYKNIQSYNEETGRKETQREYGFNRVFDFSTSASLSTTLYGFFKPWRIFGNKLSMIRHRITPSLGISYRPDFSDDLFGYYRDLHYRNKQGQEVTERYSLYTGHLFGAPGRGKSASINMSLDNNIEAKVQARNAEDSTFVSKKISLIDNLSFSTSYNLAADSFRLSDISARIALRFTKSLALNLGGSFDPYVYISYKDPSGRLQHRAIDKLRIFNGRGIGGLRGTGTSFSYTFNNETWGKIVKLFRPDVKTESKKKTEGEDTDSDAPSRDTSLGNQAAEQTSKASLYGNQDLGTYDADGYLEVQVPWNLSVNYGVNYSRDTFNHAKGDFNYKFSHSLMFSGSIQPTKNWSFNFSSSYDFEAKKIANMTIGISRDLHCWSFTASAIPFGPYKSYNFTIGVKSSLLKDLKYDKHGYSAPNSWY